MVTILMVAWASFGCSSGDQSGGGNQSGGGSQSSGGSQSAAAPRVWKCHYLSLSNDSCTCEYENADVMFTRPADSCRLSSPFDACCSYTGSLQDLTFPKCDCLNAAPGASAPVCGTIGFPNEKAVSSCDDLRPPDVTSGG
jgi:hypothetical protein